MGTPSPAVSPWTWDAEDYQGNGIHISVTFNNSTRALTGATVVRDVGCVYGTLYIGVGPDGTPNTSPNAFAVPEGTTNLNKNRLTSNGLNTIEDVEALQITAGP